MKIAINGKSIHIFNRLSHDERELVEKKIKENASGTASFYVMVVISTIIITAGLIADNAVVVIGGMLIAPLIWPLLSLSMAVIHWRPTSIKNNIYTLIITLVGVLAISFLLGMFYPLYELSSQVVLRTEPNIIDLIIALTAGFGGAFACIYSRRSPTIFGVAIAVALVPPLCTVGILLGNGRVDLAGGALLLFITNFIAILLSSMIIFLLTKFSGPTNELAVKHRKETIIYSIICFIIICIPLIFLTINIIDLASAKTITKDIFEKTFTTEELHNLAVIKSQDSYIISGNLYSAEKISQSEIDKFSSYLSERLQNNVTVNFTFVRTEVLKSITAGH
ncbi:MAG: TIGR00341 family protein [Patescibacteria group bacterium]